MTQVKSQDTDGYNALQLAFGDKSEKHANESEKGHLAKTGTNPKRFIKEFRDYSIEKNAGETITVDIFSEGDKVDVVGTSKGKGFQGVMKKHNFAGQGAAHGSKTHRRNGAIGNRSTPGRIWKNMGMPGHLGDERVTVQNLQVVQVREGDKTILVSGAVPGANGSYVVVRPAIKKPAIAGASK